MGGAGALSPNPRLYDTARPGTRRLLASLLAPRARRRRHARLFPLTRIGPGARILDVGCGAIGLRTHEPDLDITGLDVVPRPAYPGPFVLADACAELPFPTGAFDLVYASSVVEHVPPGCRQQFAAEVRRVGRGFYVQTPARSFPIEPHALLPAAHWLPAKLRRRYWRLGVCDVWEDVALLSRSEMASLFGDPVPEWAGPFVKSWTSIQPVVT